MKAITLWIVVVAGIVAASWAVHSANNTNRSTAHASAVGRPIMFQTKYATIITDSAHKARWADQRLREAVPRYQQTFGVSPGPGVIVELPYASHVNAVPKAKRRWTLPWMSRYFGTEDWRDAGPAGHHFDSDCGIKHELNHVFFTASVIPSTKRFQYGSDAPDWLDEAVALAAENPNVKERRRAHFHEQVCAGRMMPLERFITQQHPLFALPAMQKIIADHRAAGGRRATMVTVGVDQLGLPRDALMDFYAQSHATTEFLVDVSGDPKILGRIARLLKRTAVQSDLQQLKWMTEFAGPDERSLSARFADWARSAARAGKPGCAATAGTSGTSGS